MDEGTGEDSKASAGSRPRSRFKSWLASRTTCDLAVQPMRSGIDIAADSPGRKSTQAVATSPEPSSLRKHDRIHTQALSESGPEQDGDVNVNGRSDRDPDDFHAQRAEEGSGAGRPADHAQHVKWRAEENMLTWTGGQLVGSEGSREATPESHGVPWRVAHGVP